MAPRARQRALGPDKIALSTQAAPAQRELHQLPHLNGDDRLSRHALREPEQFLHLADAPGHGQLLAVAQQHRVLPLEERLQFPDLIRVDES